MNTGLNNIIKQAYNDVLGKGWDSGKQYSYCIQRALEGNPQFWWVPEALRKFPHPPDWEGVQRDEKGRYVSFPGKGSKGTHTEGKLIKIAKSLIRKGCVKEAHEIVSLTRSYNELAN